MAKTKATTKPVETKDASAAVKPVETKKVEAPKAEVKKAEPKKAEAKAEPKKAEAKKTETKAEPKKAAAKKTVAKTAETKVVVQFYGKEINTTEIVEAAKAAYIADGGKKTGIKDVQVYIKPEDNAAYYVIEGVSGKINL